MIDKSVHNDLASLPLWNVLYAVSQVFGSLHCLNMLIQANYIAGNKKPKDNIIELLSEILEESWKICKDRYTLYFQ